MFSKISPSQVTKPIEVFGGVCIGIIGSYLFVYLPELLRGTHHVDLNFLAQLLLLGAVVTAFGFWRSTTKTVA